MTSTVSQKWPYFIMTVAIMATIVVSFLIIRSAPTLDRSIAGTGPAPADRRSSPPGVTARIRAGDLEVSRRLPMLAFALEPGQTLSPRLEPGPFSADLDVSFHPGRVRQAMVGARIRGGSLIIRRGSAVLLSDHAGDEARVVMTTMPQPFANRQQQLTYSFVADGDAPTAMRALWQPVEALVPQPLPSDGAPLVDRAALRGMILAQSLNCVACHRSGDAERQASFEVSPAPILGDVGRRVRPAWIEQWLGDPRGIKVDARMPRLFDGVADSDERIADLTHFLVSLGGPIVSDELVSPAADLIPTGRAAYESIGCVACHGTWNGPQGATASASYASLGRPGQKTNPARLAEFLKDPVRVRPSGRMPAQRLTDLEADAIAAYLCAGDGPDGAAATFEVDPARAERGRAWFASSGCANCHSLGANRSPVDSVVRVAALEQLATAGLAGCLAEAPAAGVPDFGLNDAQRNALVEFLDGVNERKTENVPVDHLAASISRMRCTACHSFHAETGPSDEIARRFSAAIELDAGDEGRLPPTHSDLGARLTQPWMRQVLQDEAIARPYMATRMPQFAAQSTDALPARFASVAGVDEARAVEPQPLNESVEIGRRLVGSGGLNCIQCHSIAGHEATGTPGPDLAQMPERLRYEYFERWLLDPKSIRPSTRMPTFFLGGRSGLTEYYGGAARDQVAAIWSYLSLGISLPMPDGVLEPDSLVLVVEDEPIVFRTFMANAGVRAIACGFPEQVHYAFDADMCRLALVWTGAFLSADGAWANRGGSETNPEQVVWSAPEQPLFGGGDLKFRGYRLDEQRRPVFLYEMDIPDRPDQLFAVTEQVLPRHTDDGARLVRRFSLRTDPPFQSGRMSLKGHGTLTSGTIEDRGDDWVLLAFDEQGRAEFELEVSW